MHEIMCFNEYGNSISEFVQWDINRMMYIDPSTLTGQFIPFIES